MQDFELGLVHTLSQWGGGIPCKKYYHDHFLKREGGGKVADDHNNKKCLKLWRMMIKRLTVFPLKLGNHGKHRI